MAQPPASLLLYAFAAIGILATFAALAASLCFCGRQHDRAMFAAATAGRHAAAAQKDDGFEDDGFDDDAGELWF